MFSYLQAGSKKMMFICKLRFESKLIELKFLFPYRPGPKVHQTIGPARNFTQTCNSKLLKKIFSRLSYKNNLN